VKGSEENRPGQLKSRRVYTGKVISLDVDYRSVPDGSVGELEMVRHPGASAVVPFLSDPLGKIRKSPDPAVSYAAEGYLYEIPGGG